MVQYPFRVLVVNPDSSSTTIGIFDDETCIFTKTIEHEPSRLNSYKQIVDQYNDRTESILKELHYEEINISKLSAVCGRGGLLEPVEGGTYVVNERMLADLKRARFGEHPSNLGAWIAHTIASGLNISAYIVDPVVVNELQEVARISGIPNIPRKSVFHALSQKSAARRYAADLSKAYREVNLIVVHMGNGITVGAHYQGKVIDVNNGFDGDGPFSPVRSGSIPVHDLVSLCFSGSYSSAEITRMLVEQGGLTGYLQTSDLQEVEQRIREGDQKAELIYDAMAYQVSKEIGAMATVLRGSVDAIACTGKLAGKEMFVDRILQRVNWIADTFIYPGEHALKALNDGTLNVLREKEPAKRYPTNFILKGEWNYG